MRGRGIANGIRIRGILDFPPRITSRPLYIQRPATPVRRFRVHDRDRRIFPILGCLWIEHVMQPVLRFLEALFITQPGGYQMRQVKKQFPEIQTVGTVEGTIEFNKFCAGRRRFENELVGPVQHGVHGNIRTPYQFRTE